MKIALLLALFFLVSCVSMHPSNIEQSHVNRLEVGMHVNDFNKKIHKKPYFEKNVDNQTIRVFTFDTKKGSMYYCKSVGFIFDEKNLLLKAEYFQDSAAQQRCNNYAMSYQNSMNGFAAGLAATAATNNSSYSSTQITNTYSSKPFYGSTRGTSSLNKTGPNNVCNCKGYSGPGGPCYNGPGGAAYDGPGGPAYSGPGGPCYSGPGGPMYDGPGGPAYSGPGGAMYNGPGGPAYDGPGGAAYSGPGGPCYSGPGGPCYSGPGGTALSCPAVCK